MFDSCFEEALIFTTTAGGVSIVRLAIDRLFESLICNSKCRGIIDLCSSISFIRYTKYLADFPVKY